MKTEDIITQQIDYTPNIFSADTLLKMDIPEIEWLLYPLIPQKGISLVSAARGVGKSYFAMAAAIATASGFNFLGFKADKPRRVLYIDGEMNGKTLQDRMNQLIAGFEKEGKKVNRDNLFIFGSDFQGDNPMINFYNENDWDVLEQAITKLGHVDLIIVDNVFTLYECQDENSAASWQKFNKWSLKQRHKDRSVMWVHHTGKDIERGGRGSSAIETLLDTSLLLKTPQGHNPKNGAAIIARYTKSRSVAGKSVASFAARLISEQDNDTGKIISSSWVLQDTPMEEIEEKVKPIMDLLYEGKSVKEISKIIDISPATIYRILNDAGIKKPDKIAKEAAQEKETYKEIEI